MNHHDALLRAVCESPFDTTPRRLYADYLDDRQGTMVCQRCNGYGELSADMKPIAGKGRGKQSRYRVVCPTCQYTRKEQTDAERAAFIRANCDDETYFYPQSTPEPPPFEYEWPTIHDAGSGGIVWNWIGNNGFASFVSVSRVEDIFGGLCYRCDGAGVETFSNDEDGNMCVMCRGQRRLPDRSNLWLRHPITDVRFLNQDAYPFSDPDKPEPVKLFRGWSFPRVRWMWSCDLPVELYDHMPDYGIRVRETHSIVYSGVGMTPARVIEDATAKADEALSRGVVNLARHRCGLSRIIWPGEPGYNQTETE